MQSEGGIKVVRVENPEELNVIFGQTHFIMSASDIFETVARCVPGAKFGLAFCEASGPCLVRLEGTDPALVDLARRNALAVGAGHTFFLFLRQAFPINVLPALKALPEVCGIFCATANPVDVVLWQTELGRGVLGVVDGQSPKGVESDQDRSDRLAFLRKIGYKP